MTVPVAFRATYADWKLIKTRGVVQVVMEVPLADADAAYGVLGGMPNPGQESWFGIAPISLPVQPEEASAAPPRQDSPHAPQPDGAGKRERMEWRELQPAAQAAIRANDPQFRAFLREEMVYPDVDTEESATISIRHICRIKSRSELSTDHRKRVLWHQLDQRYQAWLAKERVGA